MFEGEDFEIENMIVDLSIPDNISVNGKSHPVVGIHGNAFMYCFSDMFLSGKLTIGKNLQYIGADAFYGCNGLDTIICKSDVPADLEDYAFEDYQKILLV
ncbi:MAG: leucine-rich repeat protein [Bacteroidales bacterium]|nr:leucine-rich repeat protein [Bacteroidales bacterium]